MSMIRTDIYKIVFFFQAEDGIRYLTVTGVQTCALPIYPETGGRNVSGLHWDMILELRNGAEVFGDGEVIYRNGRFLTQAPAAGASATAPAPRVTPPRKPAPRG